MHDMLDMHDMRPAARIARLLDEATGQDLTSRERYEFLPSIKERDFLSDAQERWLASIERRVFKTDEEDDSRAYPHTDRHR